MTEKNKSTLAGLNKEGSTMRKAACTVLSVALFVTGCATSSSDISAAYVSPLQYQSYDCDQIIAETRRLEQRVHELGGRLDEAAANDKAITGVGLILFWPALFALGGTKQQEAEYARIKGEYDALQQAAIQKKCSQQLTAQSAPGTTSTQLQPADPQATPSGTSAAPSSLSPSVPRIPGNELRVGLGTVFLGNGDWIELTSVEGALLASTQPGSSAGAMYAGNTRDVKTVKKTVVEVMGNRLGRVVTVSKNSSRQTGLASWNVEACKAPGSRFNEKLVPSFDQPECLYVRRAASSLSVVGSDFSAAILWANSSRLTTPSEYLEVGYAKYTDTGYVEVTAYLPESQGVDEGMALSWGRTLARAMNPLAGGTMTRTTFPPLFF